MEAWIQRDAVEDLFKRAGVDFEAARKLANTPEFKPIALPRLTLSANYAVDTQVIHTKNVVARVEGGVPDPAPEMGFAFRSDPFPFARKGVPSIWFASGYDFEVGGTAAVRAAHRAYISSAYHTPSDQWSEQWQFSGMVRELKFLHSAGRELANSRSWPNWSPESEFRAARERSVSSRK